MFGPVVAYFAPSETQCRGGLHFHMHVYVLQPMRGHILNRLRRGDVDEKLTDDLRNWRRAVLDKVASMEFQSVAEVYRQLGVPKDRVVSVPLSEANQKRFRVAGKVDCKCFVDCRCHEMSMRCGMFLSLSA